MTQLITICNNENLDHDSEENPENVPNNEVIVKWEVDIDEDFHHYKLW